METSFTYSQQFNLEDTFDTHLLENLNLQEAINEDTDTMHVMTDCTSEKGYTYDSFNSPSVSNSYLHYLQTDVSDNLFNCTSMQQQTLMDEQVLDLIDYDYLEQNLPSEPPTEQQENWLYEPLDTLIPAQNNLFCDDTMAIQFGLLEQQSFGNLMSNGYREDYTANSIEIGMSHDYVSLNDVNSYVAKADSEKNPCFSLYGDNLLLNEFALPSQYDFLSSSDSANEDSDDEFSETDDVCWPAMASSSSSSLYKQPKKKYNRHQKSAIEQPSCVSDYSALPTPYDFNWDSSHNKASKSAAPRAKSRKSMSNIYSLTKKKGGHKGRRGSAPHRLLTGQSTHSLASMNSSSSLTSLANNFQNAMHVSDSFCSLLSQQSIDCEDHDHPIEDGEEDYNDDDFQLKDAFGQPPVKKGRNVDKACNHCKRSHLRCDDMRPCRRCVATGKTGCRDVQHKPRGRPKLNRK